MELMLYLFYDKNTIKLLSLRKSLLGQYETVFFEKDYQSDLISDNKVTSVDYAASAIKEALQSSFANKNVEKDIYLILPQSFFHFLRFDVPSDVAPNALSAFVKDKAQALLEVHPDDCVYDYFVTESQTQKQINFFAIEVSVLSTFREALNLIDLKLFMVLPETLAYYKLFEKTLRKDKREYIWYVSYEKKQLKAYLYDTFGLLSKERWSSAVTDEKDEEVLLKEKAQELQAKGTKLNRLILAGPESENVRQDTFTKSIGVWTNPLKRIITNFYQEYVKMLVTSAEKQFPILSYDACFGAFIFSEENKTFSFFKQGAKFSRGPRFTFKAPGLPKKEILIFVASFAVSFAFFLVISRFKMPSQDLFSALKPTPTAIPTPSTPSPTPTPTVKREDLKIQVLNGSGTSGKATEVRDLLLEKGYSDIVRGNAENFDYTVTELQVKKSKKDAVNLIKEDLQKNVPSFKESVLEESDNADVVLIIGADFK